MKISVFITSYNQKFYLKQSIESVLNQSLRPFEIVVVDDCSTDGSRELLQNFAGTYPDLFKCVYNDVNQGVVNVRIKALNTITGDFVTYLDGDDLFKPGKLESEAKVFRQNPGVSIVYSNHSYLTERGEFIKNWTDQTSLPEGNIFNQTFSRNFPDRSLFKMEMVRFQDWKKVGFHDNRLRIYEDYEMRVRLTKSAKAKFNNEVLSGIRLHGTGLSSQNTAVHFDALDFIYQKNKSLLNDLSEKEREEIRMLLFPVIAKVGKKAMKEEFIKGNLRKSVEIFLKKRAYNKAI